MSVSRRAAEVTKGELKTQFLKVRPWEGAGWKGTGQELPLSVPSPLA